MAEDARANGSYATHVPHDSALSVESPKVKDAGRIKDLEDEVRTLAERANAACTLRDPVPDAETHWCEMLTARPTAQKFADYENEIRVLKAQLRQEQRKKSTTDLNGFQPPERPGLSRGSSLGSGIGSLLGSRKGHKPASLHANGVPSTREKDLEAKVVQEQTARFAAEQKAKEVNDQIDDLTSTLFQNANEMVAKERKENAELREKLEALQALEQEREVALTKGPEALQRENVKLKERLQSLELRDVDRKRRLERLEAANKRVERVRALLQPP